MSWALRTVTTAEAGPVLLERAHALALLAFDDDFSDHDWEHACGGHHVVAMADESLIGHAAVVPRRLEVGDQPWATGYVEAVATHPEWQRRGVGSAVMIAAADAIRAHHDLGALSTSRPSFYERLGWERWQGPTYVRHADHRQRSADEDDGILVLRFGRTAALDRTAAITCEARHGDHW